MYGRKEWIALDNRVLLVATEGAVKDWACYIGAVKGYDHDMEFDEVANHGTKVRRDVAEIYFPHWKHLVWRA